MKSINKIIITLVVSLLSMMSAAHADDIEYNEKAAQQAEIFKLLTWQTVNCMNAGAMNQIRMGQRDITDIALFLTKTCGTQFYRYSTMELKIEPERVSKLLLAMALDEIKNVPGVKITYKK